MRAKINILLLSVSFCFAAMKTTDVMASFDSGSEDPVSLFKSALSGIDLEQTYNDCSLKGTFSAIAKNKAHDKTALSSVRLSNRATLKSGYGLGGSYMSYRDQKDYKEFYMLGDGNCGLYSLGTTFEEANALLLANAGNAAIRQMAHNEIFDIFNSNEMNRLPSQMIDNPRYRQLSEDLSDQEIRILTGAARPHEVIAEKNRLVAEWAQEEQTFRDYVTYGLTNGNFMDYRQDLVEQNHFGRDVVTTRTYFLDTIGFLMNKNLRVWQQMLNHAPVEGRPADYYDQKIQLFHDQVHNPAWETVNLIHRGNHYNRIVPTDNANALAQAEADEERHLATYSYITMNMGMAHRYKKVLNGVMGDVIANPNAPLSMQAQGRAYQSAYLSDAELQKASANISISSADKTVTQIVLARAYALKAQELETKQNRTPAEDIKILDYKAKANALKRQTPEHLTQDLIDVEAMQIYEQARAEKDAFEDAGIAATANPLAALVYEIDEIATALYKNTDKFLKSKKEDPRYIFLKKTQAAKAKLAKNIELYSNLMLGGYTGSHPFMTAHNEAMGKINNLSDVKLRARTPFLNPALISADPYIDSWNQDISTDPRYAQDLSAKEFENLRDAVKDEVAKALAENKLSDDFLFENVKAAHDVLKSVFSTISGDGVQNKLVQRRTKRLYDTLLERAEGKDAAERKRNGTIRFCLSITANPAGCLTGKEDAVKAAEDSLFGKKEALSVGEIMSQIIIKDRRAFIDQHRFLAEAGTEAYLNIPVLLNKRLTLALNLGFTPAPMVGVFCGKPDEAKLQPGTIIERYLNGGHVDRIAFNARDLDFEARNPAYFANKLREAYLRSLKTTELSRKSTQTLGQAEMRKFRAGSPEQQREYSEVKILERAHANGFTQLEAKNRRITIDGEFAYEKLIKDAAEGAKKAEMQPDLEAIYADEWEDEWDNVWYDVWSENKDALIEEYTQQQAVAAGQTKEQYKEAEIQRLGEAEFDAMVTNDGEYARKNWLQMATTAEEESIGRGIKSLHKQETEEKGELSTRLLQQFIANDPVLNAEYRSPTFMLERQATKHFSTGTPDQLFKPEFFMYMLKKFGYVIDPNDPMESYLGASDNENKAYIAKVDEARNADFAKLMGVSAAKARSENTIRAEIRRLQAGPQSRATAQQIEALEREINPNRPRVVPISAPVSHVSQPASFMSVSEVVSSGASIEQQIAMLESLPSSRTTRLQIQSLRQRLENPGSALPSVSMPSVSRPAVVPSVPAPLYSISSRSPAPSVVVSGNAPAQVSPHDIMQEIEMLEALPTSRRTRLQIQSLRQRLENPGSALPSVSVPSVSRPAVAPYVPGGSSIPVPSVGSGSSVPAPVVLNRVDIERRIGELESQAMSRNTRLELDRLRTQLATL